MRRIPGWAGQFCSGFSLFVPLGHDRAAGAHLPYNGFEDRGHAVAAVIFVTSSTRAVGLIRYPDAASWKMVIAAAFVAYLIEFARALAMRREPNRGRRRRAAARFSDRRHLDSADPDAGDPDLIRLQATQFLLLVGAAIVSCSNARPSMPRKRARRTAGRSRASGSRRKHRWRPPALRGPRSGAPFRLAQWLRAPELEPQSGGADSCRVVDASARPFGFALMARRACHDRSIRSPSRSARMSRGSKHSLSQWCRNRSGCPRCGERKPSTTPQNRRVATACIFDQPHIGMARIAQNFARNVAEPIVSGPSSACRKPFCLS